MLGKNAKRVFFIISFFYGVGFKDFMHALKIESGLGNTILYYGFSLRVCYYRITALAEPSFVTLLGFFHHKNANKAKNNIEMGQI